ncbi:MAG: hydantoinase B/oxoprolinase family protein [SAR324 cluster bacterium]|nr:hydantoinase B/oxoprolinase family protein [SAR324 cluster bacterium]
MQFGSARVNGDPEAALERAKENALKKCARLLAGRREAEPAVAVPPPPERVLGLAAEPTAGPEPVSPSSAVIEVRAESGAAIEAFRRPARAAGAALDPITLDLIENALRNARHEMDAVLFRSAMSPVIREQHDEFPMITDPNGRMIVGQFGSYISEMLEAYPMELHPGDAILQSDPFRCGGAISHINDWMVLVPIFFDGELIGFSSMFGHMMDVGGPVPGSMPTAASSIFGEGLKIPPIKIYDRGEKNKAALDVIMNNTRTPEMNYSDLMAILAGCRAGEKRVIEICERFGKETYKEACEALLNRTNRAMRQLIVQNLPEEPQSFEDYVDDDGCGNGPFKMKLTVWREGEHAFFDWTGTSPQAEGPINFYLHEGMFKMFIGVYMIMVFDPQILFNDGFYDLIHVTMPKGSLVNPNFPAALGCRTHTLSRQFDVMGGALSKKAPELATAAGYGSSPHLLYNGFDRNGRFFQLMEILYGGIPGRPIGDGMDGHSWWPLFENIPTEYLESYYPMIIENYTTIRDSGGAGLHRGGNGVEKVYNMLEKGEISIHDDRHRSQPWGILGGKPGACSEKWLVKADGTREPVPSKIDHLKVEPGDRIIFRTAGGGGWGDPLERPPINVRNDVARHLVSEDKARDEYGVVLHGAVVEVDQRATEELRERMRASREPLPTFDFGSPPEGAPAEESPPEPPAEDLN